jgi:pyroglutamyl-peptidase
MPTILLTGFDPFERAASNPSWSAVQALARNWSGDGVLHAAQLPTVFCAAQVEIRTLMAQLRPDIVIGVGLAKGRAAMTPEVVAINLADARIPDNAGVQPRDQPVVHGGPDAYFTALPVKSMVAAMRAAGGPAAPSYSAGTFVCNHVFYTIMHEIRTRYPVMRGGFIHVPASPAEVADGSFPTLPIATMAAGLDAAIRACLTTDHVTEQSEFGAIA